MRKREEEKEDACPRREEGSGQVFPLALHRGRREGGRGYQEEEVGGALGESAVDLPGCVG